MANGFGPMAAPGTMNGENNNPLRDYVLEQLDINDESMESGMTADARERSIEREQTLLEYQDLADEYEGDADMLQCLLRDLIEGK